MQHPIRVEACRREGVGSEPGHFVHEVEEAGVADFRPGDGAPRCARTGWGTLLLLLRAGSRVLRAGLLRRCCCRRISRLRGVLLCNTRYVFRSGLPQARVSPQGDSSARLKDSNPKVLCLSPDSQNC